MSHIYTSIVSRYLLTRSNNKILRTPPPHINSSGEILHCLIHRTIAQRRANKSPFLKSYIHKVDAKSHPSPLCPLCNTFTHNTHPLFNCTHVVNSGFVDRPRGVTTSLARWTEKLAGETPAGKLDSPH